jgi:hypothetical protein
MDVVENDLLNESITTKTISTYFFTGAAIGFSHKHGASDHEDVRAVVRCTIRTWSNATTADHLADHLHGFLKKDDFARTLIESGIEAVGKPSYRAEDIALELDRVLKERRTFDVDAYYSTGSDGERA